MNLSPFNHFYEHYKKEILSSNPQIEKKVLLQDCLKKWNSLPESEKIFYYFDDIDKVPCSIQDSGSTVIAQPWFYCKTCWPNDLNKGCCLACAKKCHEGHDIQYCGWQMCYCDCALTGHCKFFDGKTYIAPDKDEINEEKTESYQSLITLPKGPGGWAPPKGITFNSHFKPPIIDDKKMGKVIKNFYYSRHHPYPDGLEIPDCFNPEIHPIN